MTILAIIILLLVVVVFWVYVSPIVIGIGIIGIGNSICKASRGKHAPVWWQILTVAVTIFSTGMLWKDIFDEAVDTGLQPFIIMIAYGVASLILIGALSTFKQKADNNRYAKKYIARRNPKFSSTSSSIPKQKSTLQKSTASNNPYTASTHRNISVEQRLSVSEVLDMIQDIYGKYEDVWCDDECSLLLDDCSMAISTYPNSELPLPEIMRQTASSYTIQMNRIMPLVHSLESAIYQLGNCSSFTSDELDSVSELYDNFTSLANSLTENYNSISDMTLTFKTQMGIPNRAVVNANKVMVSAFEKYCNNYKTILASHSAMNRNLYNILKSNKASISTQASAGIYSAGVGSSVRTSSLLSQVRKNLTVDSKIFDRYGLTFKCNLIEDCDILQLNYELSNTKQLISQISKGTDFTLKANVYDDNHNLLCIEETWVEYGQLKSGYAADFFYFSSDSMTRANSIKVYAIDPNEEDFDEDEKNISNVSNEMKQFLLDESLASRYNEILSDSLKLISTTTYPKTFFGRFNDALTNAERIISTTHSDGHKAYAQEIIDDLKLNRDKKIIEFVDRCNRKGNLYSIKDELLSGQYDLSHTVVAYINDLLKIIESEEVDVPASGEYIYCSLSFGTDGKTYFYKTTDETLKCGDEVIVPVGNKGKKGIAKIEKIERFKIGETPYPPSRTKDILGTCEY